MTIGGTATGSGTDYTLSAGTLTFNPGETSKNISPTIVDDALTEVDETILVDINNPGNATLGANTNHTYTINDNDREVQFDIVASNGSESSTPALLSVSLDMASVNTITVDYAVTGGTATGSGTDFTLAAGTLTFNPAETSKNISITVVNDTLDEDNESIQVTLSNPSNAALGTNTVHTYTINDDDLPPTVQFDATSSNGPESTTPANLAVSLSTASGKTVTVDYMTIGGTATGSGTDYTLAAGTLTFNPGETSKNISPTIVDDASLESDETIIVDINNPGNATLGGNTNHTYTIYDNDQVVEFSSISSSGDESASPVLLNLTLTPSSSNTVTVDYSVTGGNASGGGTDFTLAAGTVTFNPGETSKNISVTIVDDTLDEDNETIEVTLANPSNSTLGGNTVYTYTINDNDLPPSLDFDLASSNNAESVSSANLAVSLSTASGRTVTVDYAVTGGTATGSGTDYTLASGTLTFNAGETSKNITATIAEDVLAEADETIEVTLSNPSNATLDTILVHTYTINDNDPLATVYFSAASSNGDEATNPALITVVLSAAMGQVGTVDYAVTGGTATGGGTDFTLAAGTLTFNPGETSKDISVAINNDTLDENDETIEITLSNPSSLGLGAPTVHTYTINDNDVPPTVAFDAASSAGQEDSTPADLSVSLSTASGLTVTVDYAVTGGTATGGGTDYTLAAGTLTFNPGETNKNISVTVVDDASPESDETIEVTVSNPTNSSLGATTMHTYTINDNDGCPVGWWDCSWSRRVKITFDNSGQGALSAHPVRIALDETKIPSFYSETKTNGEDIRFIDDDGSTVLDYEIERWNTSGVSEVWVEVTTIDASSTTDFIYIYYNNSGAADAQNATAVWDANFSMVQHLNETSGTHFGSTTHANDGTNNGSAQNVGGQIGLANDFDGTNDDVSVADNADGSLDLQNASVSAWIYADSTTGDQSVLAKGDNFKIGLRGDEIWVYFYNQAAREQVTSGALLSTGTWYHIAATFQKTGGTGSTEIFLNGVSQGTLGHGKFPKADALSLLIGNDNAGNYFDGIIDELRVTNGIRSADWFKVEYLNGTDNFSTFGSVEST